jgi:hypothetical protein
MVKQRQIGDFASEIESKYGKEFRKAFMREVKHYDPSATTLTFYNVDNLEIFMQYAFQKLSA